MTEEIRTPALILLDIDGTLVEHRGSHYTQIKRKPKVLPGVKEWLEQWDKTGCRIVLLTGRRESSRAHTEKQLLDMGIFYDVLVMGVGNGPRYLFNDMKKGRKNPTAIAVNLKRNEGLRGFRM